MASNEVSDWLVERFLLGELPGGKMKELEAELKVNAGFKDKIEQIRTSNDEILKKYPLEKMGPEIKDRLAVEKVGKGYRLHTQKAGYKRWLIAAQAIITVLVLVVLILPLFKSRTGLSTKILDLDVTRIKGDDARTFEGPHLLIYRKINGGAELLKGESKVNAKDLLQIAYVNKNDSYGVILSIDGNSVVTLHYPEDVSAVPVLKKQQKVLLKSSYELDDAPGFERFFFISSNQKLDVVTLMKKARELARKGRIVRNGTMILPEGCKQYTVLLNKEE
jgi:hypothetical protein